MPSPDKERPSGRLGRLVAALRPSRAGPLPVQTGFPTSLADLVVKNHGRLKKQPSPSSRRRKGGAVSASPSPSTSPSPPPSSPPPPPPAAAGVLPWERPRPDLSPAPAARRAKSRAFGLGFCFLAVSGVVSLALLVIWSKKVVAAVTVASFSLFLLESLRCSSPLPRRPRTEAQLYLVGRGRVSPIREVEAEADTAPSRATSCSGSDCRGVLEVEPSIVSLSGAEGNSGGALEEPRDPRAKTKRRAWKKLIANARKLHGGRKSREQAREDFRSGSFRSEGGGDAATARGNVEAMDPAGSRRRVACDVVADAVASEPDSLGSRRRRSSEIQLSPTEVDAPADADDLTVEGDDEEQQQQGCSRNKKAGVVRFPGLVVLVAVALVGLVAGKLPAVAFTMLCAAFFSWAPRFRCRGGGGDGRVAVEAIGNRDAHKILVNYNCTSG